jgi:hypothetical protein
MCLVSATGLIRQTLDYRCIKDSPGNSGENQPCRQLRRRFRQNGGKTKIVETSLAAGLFLSSPVVAIAACGVVG